MLAARAGLLSPAALAFVSAPASFVLMRALCARAARAGATYAEMKAAAKADPGKEWLEGSVPDGAGVTRKLHIDQQQIVEAIKRGAEDLPEVAKEAMEHRAMHSGDKSSHTPTAKDKWPDL